MVCIHLISIGEKDNIPQTIVNSEWCANIFRHTFGTLVCSSKIRAYSLSL